MDYDELKMELNSFQKKVILFGSLILLLIVAFTFTYIKFIIPNEEINTNPTQNQYDDQVKTSYYTNNEEQTSPQTTTSTQTCDYSSYQSQIDTLNTRIDNCNKGYIEKQNDVDDLQFQLNQVRKELNNMSELYQDTRTKLLTSEFNLLKAEAELNYTFPYVERFNRGINLKEHYKNLGDYDDNVEPIVLEYLQLDKPQAPKNDYELWQRAKMIYNWISYRFSYCGDRDILLGGTYTHFQFYTPDELLSNDNHWCNDCDGFATLFAGMMYASGVPEDKVIMVCGKVETGGHCWNWLKVENKFYTIDSVCSQGKYLEEVWGIPLWWKDEKQSYPFSSTYDDVKCFKEYTPTVYLTPSKYQELKNEIKD